MYAQSFHRNINHKVKVQTMRSRIVRVLAAFASADGRYYLSVVVRKTSTIDGPVLVVVLAIVLLLLLVNEPLTVDGDMYISRHRQKPHTTPLLRLPRESQIALQIKKNKVEGGCLVTLLNNTKKGNLKSGGGGWDFRYFSDSLKIQLTINNQLLQEKKSVVLSESCLKQKCSSCLSLWGHFIRSNAVLALCFVMLLCGNVNGCSNKRRTCVKDCLYASHWTGKFVLTG